MIFSVPSNGLDRGAADKAERAADHAADEAVQVLFQPGQGAGLVAVQAQAVFQSGDQPSPVLAAGRCASPGARRGMYVVCHADPYLW